MAVNLQQSSCLCLLSAGTTGVHHHTSLLFHVFIMKRWCWDFSVCTEMIVWVLCVLCWFDVCTLLIWHVHLNKSFLVLIIILTIPCWVQSASVLLRKFCLYIHERDSSAAFFPSNVYFEPQWYWTHKMLHILNQTKTKENKSRQTICTQTNSHSVSRWNALKLC